jgi:phospholipase C
MSNRIFALSCSLGLWASGCGGETGPDRAPGATSGAIEYLDLADAGGQRAAADLNCGDAGLTCSGATHCFESACRASQIEHVVLIVQENHTFDSYFGAYCQATAGSNPNCTQGRGCCEAAPATSPEGSPPEVLDDASNVGSDRNHSQGCEVSQIDLGKMDHYTRGPNHDSTICEPACSTGANFAVAQGDGAHPVVAAYWQLADANALGDRYFQPIEGSSSSNDMYLAVAHAQFVDNTDTPNSIGSGCDDPTGIDICGVDGAPTLFEGRPTIVDLLHGAGQSFTVYADGYAAAVQAGAGNCASTPRECPYDEVTSPIEARSCLYDPSDFPYQYYAQLTDRLDLFKDFDRLGADLSNGTLPAVAFVKARTFHNEHPGFSTITDGVDFATGVIDAIQSSAYQPNTLILLLWDEGGGFFDHLAPPEYASPPAPSVDIDDQGQPVIHGTRVPLLAIGPFARTGTISHVQMDHASIVRFLEYNFAGPVGQLGHADRLVNNLGSLLEPATTGIPIPEGQ